MPKWKSNFNPNWLHNPEFSTWLVHRDDSSAHCKLCEKTFSITTLGISALRSHAKGVKHKDKISQQKQSTTVLDFFAHSKNESTTSAISEPEPQDTSTLEAQPSSSIMADPTRPGYNAARNFIEKSTEAETLWVLNVVMKHMSYRSCDGLNELFSIMFPDSEIAQRFSLARDKARYMITYGLAPYFHDNLRSILTSIDPVPLYSVSFDESMNRILQRGQMDLHVRYWCDTKKIACTRYWTSVYTEKATALDLFNCFCQGMAELELNSILQLSMDGPNVNWALLDLLKEERSDAPALLETGSCGLHIMHRAFQTGHEATGWKLDVLLSSLWYCFKDSPSRRSDYKKVCGSDVLFPLKFCKCRWIENSQVAERATKIWCDIRRYVTTVASSEAKQLKLTKPKNESFAKVASFMEDPLIIAKLQFFKTISDEVKPFLTTYQTDFPMMPFLANDWKKVLMSLLRRFISGDVLSKLSDSQLCAVDVLDEKILLQLKDIDVGFAVRHFLLSNNISISKRIALRIECRKFLQSMVARLMEKSPLRYSVVRHAECFDPNELCRVSTEKNVKKFKKLLACLQRSGRVTADWCENVAKQFNQFCEIMKRDHSDSMEIFNKQHLRVDEFLVPFLEKKEFLDVYRVFKMVNQPNPFSYNILCT